MSARCSSSSALLAWSGASAIPMLASTFSATPSNVIGACSADWTVAASASASSTGWVGVRIREWRIAYSSLPRRASSVSGSSSARRRAATSRSTASPALWPSVSLICLNASRSSSSTATDPPLVLCARERAGGVLAKQRAVGQPRERVVAREAIVLLRLAAQPLGGGGDDPVQDRPQQREAEEHEQRDRALVVADRGGDRPVAQVDLERPRRGAGAGEAQGNVDLDEPAQTDLAGGLGVQRGCDHLGRIGCSRRGRRADRRPRSPSAAPDQGVVVGVDDPARRAPDLDPREVARDRACAQLLVERVDALRTESFAQVAGREPGLDPQPRHQLRGLVRVGEGALHDLRLQHPRKHEARARRSGPGSTARPGRSG